MAEQSQELRIEEANLVEIPVILQFRKALFCEMGIPESSFVDNVSEVISERYISEFIKGNLKHFIAYNDSKVPVAIAGALIKDDFPYYLFKPGFYGWIIDVYTEPAYRGRKLATKLINLTQEWLIQKGVSEVKLIASGSEARKLYDKLGYKATWEMSLNLSGKPTFNEFIDQRVDGDII